ncbi:MAG: DUF389 domain-containing protein [Verrucomicrobiaceae bacterium]
MSVVLVIRQEEKAAVLKEIALRIAGGMEMELKIWVATEGEEAAGWAKNLEGVGVTEVVEMNGPRRRRLVEAAVAEAKPELLIVGKSAGVKSDAPDRKFSGWLFEHLPCQVLVVRIDGEEAPHEGKVLVPCAGGRNSRRALKIAHAWAGPETVAFQVRPDVDEISMAVGEAALEKIVKRAGLDPTLLHTKVVLGDHFAKALEEEVASGEYAMLLLGATNEKTLRGKLFGTLPERLLASETGRLVGVVRAERAVGHRFRDWVGRLIQIKIPQLNRDERLALFDEVESKSRWSFDFASLMTMATAIAGMGLLLNSAAVVIGAMLVAPLMMPLVGGGLALSQGHWPLWNRAIGAVVRGFVLALLIGLVLGGIARFFDLGMTFQLEARGKPNLLDLGVAFVSGIAASYCIARPKLSGALAGVAIAAALVPPIATVGIALVLGDTSTSTGAALLFGTNVVAVVLGASFNFVLAGVRGRGRDGEWARRGLIVLMLIMAGLLVPLTSFLFTGLSQSTHVERRVEPVLPKGMKLVSVLRMDGGGYEVVVESPRPLTRALQEKIKAALGGLEEVRLRTILVID